MRYRVAMLVGDGEGAWVTREIEVDALDEEDAYYRALERFSELGYQVNEDEVWVVENVEDLEYGEVE